MQTEPILKFCEAHGDLPEPLRSKAADVCMFCAALQINRARARRTDPETSLAAAKSVSISSGRRIVLKAFLRACVPICDEHLTILTKGEISPSGARSRRSELTRAGLIRYTGKDIKTESGRWTMTYELALGREFYEDLVR